MDRDGREREPRIMTTEAGLALEELETMIERIHSHGREAARTETAAGCPDAGAGNGATGAAGEAAAEIAAETVAGVPGETAAKLSGETAAKHSAETAAVSGKIPAAVSRRPAGIKAGIARPYDGLLVAFFVPVVIMIIVFIQRGIFPFGENSFLRTDMYHQYAPFFAEFKEKLASGDSLLYSWDVGMGVNFSALYAYYLASPFNWLIVLCPRDYVIEFMSYMVVLKIGLSGLTMAWYLRRHNKTSDIGIGVFGVFYALSGYMAAYSWNIMWLDCILLFPLIMLGAERLVNEKKPHLYCAALGLSILSNYYISIMICMFLILWFIALQILKGWRGMRELLGTGARFVIYSVLAGGVSAAVVLPAVFALKATASGNISFPKTIDSYFSIIDMMARHIGNVETEIGLDHWPNIYCGVAVYMFLALFVMCRRVSLREKAVYLLTLLFFYLSFSVNVLNFIWHGFHYPNSLPCRQSFIYIFLVLAVCFKAYAHLREFSLKQVGIAFWLSIGFVVLAEKVVTEAHFHFSVFYVAILFLAAYGGIIWYYKQPGSSRMAAAILMLAVVSVEAAANTAVTSVTTTSRTSYTMDNKDVRALVGGLKPADDFYRVEKIDRKTKNDGAWLGFPSVSLFSSTASADMSRFFKAMGCESSTNAYSITGSTPLVDALFSVRYALYPEEQWNRPELTLAAESGQVWLYENPDVLPLGYMVPGALDLDWNFELTNPADVQNQLSDILNVPYTMMDAPGESLGNRFTFTPEESGEYYVFITNRQVERVTAVWGENTKTFDHINRGYFLELGPLIAGQTVTVTGDGNEELTARAYRFSYDGLRAVTGALGREPWRLTSWTSSSLKGTVTAEEPGLLMTTIPYDRGWQIAVDGRPVTARKMLGAFLGVELSAGDHEIEMHYMPEGLKPGIYISGVSAALFILSLTLAGRKKRRKKRHETVGRKIYQGDR